MAHSQAANTIRDSIYGEIELSPLPLRIVNTPEFQRLRHIAQLGGVSYVFPSASHTRYQHSLGTAFLAGRLVRQLKSEQARKDNDQNYSENDDDPDILCAEIAGLCHDLGHGPFSRLFEDEFMPHEGEGDWKHENYSCEMLDEILNRMKDDVDAQNFLPGTENNVFIKEMITGLPVLGKEDSYENRKKQKWFLYQIMSDKNSVADASKYDYMARDTRMLYGIDLGNPISTIESLTVEKYGEGMNRIRFKDDVPQFDRILMNEAVSALQENAYKHPNVKAVEHMILDAFVAANKGSNSKISQQAKTVPGLLTLDDRIINSDHFSEEKSREAHEILTRINKTDFYQLVEQTFVGKEVAKMSKKDITEDIIKIDTSLRDKIKVSVWKIEAYRKNPLPLPNRETSTTLPQQLTETVVQVFCVNKEDEVKIRSVFEEWKSNLKPFMHQDTMKLEELRSQALSLSTSLKTVCDLIESLTDTLPSDNGQRKRRKLDDADEPTNAKTMKTD